MKLNKISLTIFLFTVILFSVLIGSGRASVQDEINARNRQIEEIQRQIEQYQIEIDKNSSQAKTLNNEIAGLNAKISKIQLEIRSLDLSITQTKTEIDSTQNQINDLKGKLDLHKEALSKYISIIYQTDQSTLTDIIFKNQRLSDFFDNLKNIQDSQNNLKTAIVNIKDLKTDLENKESSLQDKQSELEQLKGIQEGQKKNLNGNKAAKNNILQETKGQEAKFQQLVKQSQQDIQKIRDQIFYLQQNGVSVEDAIKFGQLAALRVGIRPAFLIAVLEVESGLGKNVGTGNWIDDMYNCYLRLGKPSRAETEKAAFLQITSQLGLDPSNVKVSREPNYGCGGALGPAQFLPSTWLGYVDRVSALTGHNPPNPWNIEDAFMASAIKLAGSGADKKTRSGEIAAAKAYISGNASCGSSICNYYANLVLDKAAIIEQNL